MKIFCDRHHAALSHSLFLLFEGRLGHELYFPIGMDWANEKWWLIHAPYNFNEETAKQYLQIKPEYKPMDGTVPLNRVTKEYPTHYEVEDIAFGYKQKCITLEQFKNMDIDIIIATYQPHYELYTKLRDTFHPKAKVVAQMGNYWDIDCAVVKNLMASVAYFGMPHEVNNVFYHQEFDTSLYRVRETPYWNTSKEINSFINTLSTQNIFQKDWKNFLALEQLLSEWSFASYGASCRDGIENHQEGIAYLMGNSKWAFHCKTGGDGYGHVLHQWLACGRPVIYRGSQYKNKLGGLLLKDLETGIDLDKHSIIETAKIIKEMSDEEHKKMCDTAYRTFKENVDFDKEEQVIREFIDRLI